MVYCKIVIVVLFLIFSLPQSTFAAWPSSDSLLKTMAPIAGLDSDEVEAVLFSLKYPQCSTTVVSYTVSQDYSLVGFIGTLKTSKLTNIPNLTSLNKANCKKTNPTQRAYRFIEDQGDSILGKDTAALLKEILSEQIAQGKSELDSQVASIPYVGTILSNWDCACDAAFETTFPTETLVDQKVGAVMQVLDNIKKGNIGTAIEILFANFGAEMSCKFLAVQSGVEAVPIVSNLANQACSSILGESLSFVIDGADDVAKALGIKGYDHISPDEYYKAYMAYDIGVNNYLAKADSFYNQCYIYFEPSSMSADTARKVCVLLRQRYVNESVAKIEWKEASFAKVDYYQANIKAKAAKSVFVKESDFQKEIFNQISICENYFKQKYPKALAYEYADKQFCSQTEVENIMWEARKKAQQTLVSTTLPFTQPFCDYRTPNQTALGCSVEGAPLCRQYLSNNACTKSTKYPGGVDVPCCQIDSSAASKSFMDIVQKTSNFSKELDGGIYCKIDNPSNPLQISCSLNEAYKMCQTKIGAESLKSCATTAQYKSSVYQYQCCQYVPEKLNSVLGTQTAKNFVDLKNKQNPGSCSLGGVTEGFSFDPRIVRCSTAAQVAQCKTIFYKQCSFNAQGYATAGCCVKDPFGSWSTNVGTTSESLSDRDGSRSSGSTSVSKTTSLYGHDFSLVNKIFNGESRGTKTEGEKRFDTVNNSPDEPSRASKGGLFSKITSIFEQTVSVVRGIFTAETRTLPRDVDDKPDPSREQKVYNENIDPLDGVRTNNATTSTNSDRRVPVSNYPEESKRDISSTKNSTSTNSRNIEIENTVRTVPNTASATSSVREGNLRVSTTTTIRIQSSEYDNVEVGTSTRSSTTVATTTRGIEVSSENERGTSDSSVVNSGSANQNVRGTILPESTEGLLVSPVVTPRTR